MAKDNILISAQWSEMIMNLPADKAGELFKAIYIIRENPNYEINDPVLAAIFSMMKQFILSNEKKYQEKCEKMAANSAKRNFANGDSSKNGTNQQLLSIVTDCKQIGSDNDNDNDYDNDNDIDSDNESLCNTNVLHCPTESDEEENSRYDDIVITWNELEHFGITPIRKIATNSPREKLLKARLKQYGRNSFDEVVNAIKDSDFLQGKHNGKPWQVTFDWIIRPSNYAKVLEGNYKNTRAPTGGGGFFADILGG